MSTKGFKFAADAIVFGRDCDTGEPHALFVRRRWEPFQDCWALPGGHVELHETAEQAARRELTEETGLTALGRMECVGWYDAPGRDPRGRVISAAYVGVLDHMPCPVAADDAADACWFPLTAMLAEPQALAFDHGRILTDALSKVRSLGWWF